MNCKQYIIAILVSINLGMALNAADERRAPASPPREDFLDLSASAILRISLGIAEDDEYSILTELDNWGKTGRYGVICFGRIEFCPRAGGADLKFINAEAARNFSAIIYRNMQIGEGETADEQKKVNEASIFLSTSELERFYLHLQEAEHDNYNAEGRVG